MKIHELLDQSIQKKSGKIALNHDNKCVTYEELKNRNTKICFELKSKGINNSDSIAVIIDNSIEFVQAFLAINMSGGIIVPVYPKTGINKLTGILNYYNIKFIITLDKYNDFINEDIFMDCSEVKGMFYMSDDKMSYIENKDFKSLDDSDCPVAYGDDLSDVSLILFSSGTTNMPKGIMLTDENIVSNVIAISGYLELEAEDKILIIKNINHASSITGELLVGLYNGCTVYMTSKIPSAALIFQYIEKFKLTVLFAVPSIINNMLGSSHVNFFNLNSLRILNFYGGTMAYSKIEELAERFPWVNLIYSYGLTEASPRVTYIMKKELLKKLTSSGKPISGVEVFIADEQGKVLEPGNVGEIAVKGSNVMKGYFRNTELSKKRLRNGMLFTGDVGYVDTDNYLYVTGRKDNLIIISGKNVYPEEIESVLYSFKGIKEVLVRGEKNDGFDIRVVAYVVFDTDIEWNCNDIFNYCRRYLEDYKLPNKVIKVGELKKTVSGKIVRNQEMYDVQYTNADI